MIREVVEAITNCFSMEIRMLIDDYSDKKVKELDNQVKEAFRQAFDLLYFICMNEVFVFKENLFQKSVSKYHEELIKIGIHKPDNQHLLDCCSLSRYYDNNLVFITDDKGIFEHENEIFKLLGLNIFNPRAYYLDDSSRYL